MGWDELIEEHKRQTGWDDEDEREVRDLLIRAANTLADPVEEEDELLSYDELAKWLKVKKNTLQQWVSRGQIPCIRTGRTVRFSKRQILTKLREWQE